MAEPDPHPPGDLCVLAARQALFMRVAPTLRHDLVGEFQALGFAVSLARKSCQRELPLADIGAAIDRIGQQVAVAQRSGQALLGWLRPEGADLVTLGEALRQSFALVAFDWNLRDIEATQHVGTPDWVVPRAAVCETLLALLLATGDALDSRATVRLSLRRRDGQLVIGLRSRGKPPASDAESPDIVDCERRFGWQEAAALVGAHGARLVRRDGHVMAWIAVDAVADR